MTEFYLCHLYFDFFISFLALGRQKVTYMSKNFSILEFGLTIFCAKNAITYTTHYHANQ